MISALPKLAHYCLGHDHAKAILNQQIIQGSLGPAWLLSGDKGIGKATFAYHYAIMILEGITEKESVAFFNNHSKAETATYTLIKNQIHPDFYCLEAEQENDLTIEKIRSLTHFLQKTPVLSKRRVALIDGANLMTRQAGNALLKTLEEPPTQAIIFLISHGATLTTLKSRCQRLLFHPLPLKDTQEILKSYWLDEKPSDQKIFLKYFSGHPGIFNYFQDGKLNIFEHLQQFECCDYGYQEILDFADFYKDATETVQYGVLFWISDLIENRKEDSIFLQKASEIWLDIHHLFNEFRTLHMDFPQFMIKIFEKIRPLFRTNG